MDRDCQRELLACVVGYGYRVESDTILQLISAPRGFSLVFIYDTHTSLVPDGCFPGGVVDDGPGVRH